MVAGGEPVVLSATVQNAGSDMDQFTVDIEELDPTWYTIQVESVALMPGDITTIPIKLHPPKSDAARIGRHVFQVRAISARDPRLMGTTRGTLEIGSESVAITVTPVELEWIAGSPPAELIAEVTNAGVTVDKYDIEVDYIEPSWYTITMGGMALFPGDKVAIPIKIHPPLGADTPAGHYAFEIRARSQANTNLVASTMGVIYVVPKLEYDLTVVEPQRITGRSGTYNLNLTNEGNVGIRIDLSASDPDDALAYNFLVPDPKVVVQQHSATRVQLQVKPKKPKLVGPNQIYQFDVTGRALGADKDENLSNDAVNASATLIYTPYLKNWRLPVFAALLGALLLWWLLPVGGPAVSACKSPVNGIVCPPTPTAVVPPTALPTGTPLPPPTSTAAPPSLTPTATLTATATLTPTPVSLKVIEDSDFTVRQGYTLGSGTYRDNTSAHWIFGKNSGFDTMTANFQLASVPNVTTTLVIYGVDSEDEAKTPIHVRLNTTTLYRGMDPLPNDKPVPKNVTDPVPWGRFELPVAPGILSSNNVLQIENLDPNGRPDYPDLSYPIFVIIDKVELVLGH